jgi:hypothetical protein
MGDAVYRSAPVGAFANWPDAARVYEFIVAKIHAYQTKSMEQREVDLVTYGDPIAWTLTLSYQLVSKIRLPRQGVAIPLA